jgi:hypothetical protein
LVLAAPVVPKAEILDQVAIMDDLVPLVLLLYSLPVAVVGRQPLLVSGTMAVVAVALADIQATADAADKLNMPMVDWVATVGEEGEHILEAVATAARADVAA